MSRTRSRILDRVNSQWSVLLVGGVSGTGKTTVAKTIAREHGITWVQVDDLRLALQWSDVRLPNDVATEALYFFERTRDIWSLPADHLRDGLIAVGEVMTAAIAVVIGNHIVQNDPVVIEGDGILPTILERPALRGFVDSGQLRTVFLTPSSEDELLHNMIHRGRGVPDKRECELRRIVEMNWLFTQWLEHEATMRSLPIVSTQPWKTLAARVDHFERLGDRVSTDCRGDS